MNKLYALKSVDDRYVTTVDASLPELGGPESALTFPNRAAANIAAKTHAELLGVELVPVPWGPSTRGFMGGDRVRFRTPLTHEEECERFEVLEPRGERVLVRLIGSGMRIEPTFVYLTSDMRLEDDIKQALEKLPSR